MTSGTPTQTTPRPAADELTEERAARRRLPRFDLSATQLIATALAATTATFLASYLGVSGTIIGAAVASVATAIGNAVYGQSLRNTRDRVRVAVPAGRRPRIDPSSPTVAVASQTVPPVLPATQRRETSPRPADPARAWRRVALIAAAVFAAVLALVTSVELLAGRPITDLVRGDTGTGTTLFGAPQHRSSPGQPVPTVTRTVTPKVVVTTPTVTQTAPAVTKTATPTQTATMAPTTPAPASSGTPGTTSGTPTPTSTGTP